MILAHLTASALRAALLLGLALAALPLLRRAPAEARRLVLALALAGALILPAVSAVAPAWRVPAGASLPVLRGEPFAEPLSTEGPALAVTASAGVRPPALARPAPRFDPASIVALVWTIGSLVVAGRLLLGIQRARRMVRRARPAASWNRAVARAGVRVAVRLSDEIDAPAVTGVISPVVLVPRASETWSDARREAVLLHESAHVRGRDCLAGVVAQLACALHWFNPLAWIAARRLRLERELAADEAVLAAGTLPSSYAEDLLAIAGAVTSPARSAAVAALGMAEPSQLVRRVTAIVSPSPSRSPLSRRAGTALAAATGLALLAIACTTPEGPSAAPQSAGLPPPPAAGGSASTIDRRIQHIADEELDRTLAEWKAAAGAVVVLDPATGEILANAGRAQGAPADVGVQRAYVTGSTLKAMLLAAALEEGAVSPGDRFDCENGARSYGGKILHDAGKNGTLTLPEMLAVSTNVGFSKVFDRLGGEKLDRWLHRFHFGAAPLPGAAAGQVPGRAEDRSFEGAVLAVGEAMTASPIQVAAAYAALANDGAYVPPTLTRRAGPAPREALLKPETARTVLSMLEQVVTGEHATGKEARIAGTRVAGKTGTAEWESSGGGIYASFVGIVPADRPRFVILVGVEGPREGGYGGTVAAPTFARVASRVLAGGN